MLNAIKATVGLFGGALTVGGVLGYVIFTVNWMRKPQYSWERSVDDKPSKDYEDEAKSMIKIGKWLKRLLPVGILFVLLAILIPTTKQACIIYVLPKIANNEQIQQIPQKLLDIGNKALDEWIKEYTPTKSEK